jgi:hypothetical protein
VKNWFQAFAFEFDLYRYTEPGAGRREGRSPIGPVRPGPMPTGAPSLNPEERGGNPASRLGGNMSNRMTNNAVLRDAAMSNLAAAAAEGAIKIGGGGAGANKNGNGSDGGGGGRGDASDREPSLGGVDGRGDERGEDDGNGGGGGNGGGAGGNGGNSGGEGAEQQQRRGGSPSGNDAHAASLVAKLDAMAGSGGHANLISQLSAEELAMYVSGNSNGGAVQVELS